MGERANSRPEPGGEGSGQGGWRYPGGRAPSLKSLPPRPSAGFLSRSHLALERILLAGMDVIEICAPHGFGKTSQLAQWYREAIVSGRQALWLSIDPRDDAARLVGILADAASRLTRDDVFLPSLVSWIGGCADPQQAVTAWLAEVALLPRETLLLIDDADLVSAQARPTLEYLVANAPANLRIAASLRPNGSFANSDLLASTPMMRITARELRLREEETVSLVRQLVGSGERGSDLDRFAVEVHAHAAGWPLGVRLAIAARLRSPDGSPTAHSLADIGNYMIANLVDRQSPEVAEMLVRAARFDPIHPDLLRAVLGPSCASDALATLAAESPVVIGDGVGGWFRLHPSARETLVARQASLPDATLRAEASLASAWYAEHGMLEEAAQQAELAGDAARAIELAETSVRQLLDLGRNGEIIGWLERLSPSEIAARPGFWAPAGWAVANTSRAEESRRFAEAIHNDPRSSEIERYEADLIYSAAAAHTDDHGQWDLLQQRWPSPPKGASQSQMLLHSVTLAHREIVSGRADIGRQRLVSPFADKGLPGAPAPVSLGFVEALRGLSYLWEGKPLIALDILRKGIETVEARMDRRTRVAVTLAALLAEAALATDNPAEAARLMSQRSFQVNREGIPEAVIAACTTLADLACDEGRQDRAIDRISSLLGEGVARGSPRMQAVAHFASARLHARHGRPHSAAQDADRAEALCNSQGDAVHPAIRQFCRLQACLARATADCSGSNVDRIALAEQAADRALDIATRLQRGADAARALFLRAEARKRLGNPAAAEDAAEAASICNAGGLQRLLAEFAASPSSNLREPPAVQAGGSGSGPVSGAETRPARYAGSLLTPREFDVVCHLASHMSNKEIAMAMGLGEETVKWHVKNLFQKLDGGDRKTVVRRARMLGII